MAMPERTAVRHYEAVAWPVSWSAIWVGALAVLAAGLVFGLIGIALEAHPMGAAARIGDWHTVRILTMVFSICGAFLSSVIGGWVAGRILGTRQAEPAMLHGAIAWLVTVPLLLVAAGIGAAGHFGAWYGGLAGTPIWVTTTVTSVDPQVAAATRNGALAAVTALLLGLVGSVIGGWMASGEPMTFTHYRTRAAVGRGNLP